jgi:hypothetical protein
MEIFNFSLENLSGILSLINNEFAISKNNKTLVLVNKIKENSFLREIEELSWNENGIVILQLHNNENKFLENSIEKILDINFNEFNGVILLDVLQKLNSPQILLDKIKNKKTLIIFPSKFREISKEVEFSELIVTENLEVIEGLSEKLLNILYSTTYCVNFDNCLSPSEKEKLLIIKSYTGELSNNYIISCKKDSSEIILKLKPVTMLDYTHDNLNINKSNEMRENIMAVFCKENLSYKIIGNTGSYLNDINHLNKMLNEGY